MIPSITLATAAIVVAAILVGVLAIGMIVLPQQAEADCPPFPRGCGQAGTHASFPHNTTAPYKIHNADI
jgi:hypothetical protein